MLPALTTTSSCLASVLSEEWESSTADLYTVAFELFTMLQQMQRLSILLAFCLNQLTQEHQLCIAPSGLHHALCMAVKNSI